MGRLRGHGRWHRHADRVSLHVLVSVSAAHADREGDPAVRLLRSLRSLRARYRLPPAVTEVPQMARLLGRGRWYATLCATSAVSSATSAVPCATPAVSGRRPLEWTPVASGGLRREPEPERERAAEPRIPQNSEHFAGAPRCSRGAPGAAGEVPR